ncbi:universal stress protein [Tundrisphaera lichenicola]|uniref:universal stress protein n=1 Tax=Tundrisphaera lichenicola TaxID=2029860 RepID=UPI003EBAF3A8
MIPVETILHPTDFSEQADHAYQLARLIARERGARLIVLHVARIYVDAPAFVPPEVGSLVLNLPESQADYRAGLEAKLNERIELAAHVGDDRTILGNDPKQDVHARELRRPEARLEEGDPVDEILRVADEVECDLIVMGTHGRSGLGRLLTGGVTEAVVRRARCPVLTFRGPESAESWDRSKAILHPTDFSECSELALQTARTIAQRCETRLVLIHVLPTQTVIFGTVPVSCDVPSIRDSLTAMASRVDGPDLKHPVEFRLIRGDPASEILRIAEDEGDRSLIVMGSHGRTGLRHLFMGSVAEAVLRKAACPVLTVKAPHPEGAHASLAEHSRSGG